MKQLGLALVVVASIGAMAWRLGPSPLELEQVMGWPAPGAPLLAPPRLQGVNAQVLRVYLDAGHGAPGNTGNVSALCEDEQDFTLALAEAVALEVAATPGMTVKLSRARGAMVEYSERVREAERWGADAFVSLHSDVRRGRDEPAAESRCTVSRGATGFSVLWSDTGAPSLLERRARLARAVARSLESIGLPAYDGADYRPLYEPDGDQSGVFLDRHPAPERIFVLHRPVLASVIVETHHARDDREALRWREPATRLAFARALASALHDWATELR